MDSFKVTYFDLAVLGAILGYIFGFIPVIFGVVRRRVVLGFLGLVSSVIAGAGGSFLLALPVVAVFVWLITREPRTAKAEAPRTVAADNPDNP